MGASIKCIRSQPGCSFFRLDPVEYVDRTCQLSHNPIIIVFHIRGGIPNSKIEKCKFKLKAATNELCVAFSSQHLPDKFQQSSIETQIDDIDPRIPHIPVPFFIKQLPNISFKIPFVTIDCHFWHDQSSDFSDSCHHQIEIYLALKQ